MKRFNTAGTCFPKRHYMVDISERVAIIRKMVEDGEYFCFNRKKEPEMKTVDVGGRTIYEAVM